MVTATECVIALARSAQPDPVPPGLPGPPGPGVPDGWLARFLRDPGGHVGAVPGWLWRTVQEHGPLLMGAAVAVLVTVVAGAVAVGWAQRRMATRAVWLEITPPARLSADGASAWWHGLSGMVNRSGRTRWTQWTRWGWWVPSGWRRLALEFVADQSGVRAGVWVPPTMPADQVERLIPRAWPGARVKQRTRPVWSGLYVSATERFPRGGEWAPLVEPSARELRPASEVSEEPLRLLLDALSLSTRDGEGIAGVQLVVRRQRRIRARSRSWSVLRALALAPARLVDAVVSPNTTAGERARQRARAERSRAEVDPLVLAEQRARDTKRAAGSHLRTTVRVLAATQSGGGWARQWRASTVAEVAAGFDAIARATFLRSRRVRRAATTATTRMAGRREFAATMPELAALWHPPVEPGLYGMPGSAARTRAPSRDLPRLSSRASWNDSHDDMWAGDGDV